MARLRARKVAGQAKKLIEAVTARTANRSSGHGGLPSAFQKPSPKPARATKPRSGWTGGQANVAPTVRGHGGLPPSHAKPVGIRTSKKSAKPSWSGLGSNRGPQRRQRVQSLKAAVKSKFPLAHSTSLASGSAAAIRNARRQNPGIKGRAILGKIRKHSPSSGMAVYDAKTKKALPSLPANAKGRLVRVSRHGGKTTMKQVGSFGNKAPRVGAHTSIKGMGAKIPVNKKHRGFGKAISLGASIGKDSIRANLRGGGRRLITANRVLRLGAGKTMARSARIAARPITNKLKSLGSQIKARASAAKLRLVGNL